MAEPTFVLRQNNPLFLTNSEISRRFSSLDELKCILFESGLRWNPNAELQIHRCDDKGLIKHSVYFYIMDKLQYPVNLDDEIKILNNYKSTTITNPYVEVDKPAVISSVYFKHEKNGLHWFIRYQNLCKRDIVVNKNLHQIWPVNTGKIPYDLTRIFSKVR